METRELIHHIGEDVGIAFYWDADGADAWPDIVEIGGELPPHFYIIESHPTEIRSIYQDEISIIHYPQKPSAIMQSTAEYREIIKILWNYLKVGNAAGRRKRIVDWGEFEFLRFLYNHKDEWTSRGVLYVRLHHPVTIRSWHEDDPELEKPRQVTVVGMREFYNPARGYQFHGVELTLAAIERQRYIPYIEAPNLNTEGHHHGGGES